MTGLWSEGIVLAFLTRFDPTTAWEVEVLYRLIPDGGDDFGVAGYLVHGRGVLNFLPDGISEDGARAALRF